MPARITLLGVALTGSLFFAGCAGPAKTSPPLLSQPVAEAGPSAAAQTPGNRPALIQSKVRPIIFPIDWSETDADAKIIKRYSVYWDAMFEKLQFRWENELKSRIYPGAGKHAIITFIMDSSGEIRRIKKIDGNAGKRGEEACVTAIKSAAPYGKWSADMRADLGDEQELTINFYYQ